MLKSQSKTVLDFFVVVIYTGRRQIFLKCNLENYRI